MGILSTLGKWCQVRYASPRGYIVEVEGPRQTTRHAFGEDDLITATTAAQRWRKMMDSGTPLINSVSFYYVSDAQLLSKRTRTVSEVWHPKGPYSPAEARKVREAANRAHAALGFGQFTSSPTGSMSSLINSYVDQCESDTAHDCSCQR